MRPVPRRPSCRSSCPMPTERPSSGREENSPRPGRGSRTRSPRCQGDAGMPACGGAGFPPSGGCCPTRSSRCRSPSPTRGRGGRGWPRLGCRGGRLGSRLLGRRRCREGTEDCRQRHCAGKHSRLHVASVLVEESPPARTQAGDNNSSVRIDGRRPAVKLRRVLSSGGGYVCAGFRFPKIQAMPMLKA